jgi:2-dehydropantoate 2-reductase
MAVVIAVLGIGGVGGLIAARTGALCLASERTAAVIDETGLTFVRDGLTTVTHPRTVLRLDEPVSVLVVAVKAPALSAALERVEPEAVHGAIVLPLLNGLEHLAAIRASLAGATVVAGSIGRVEVVSPEPGFVVQRTPGALVAVASDVLTDAELRDRLAPLDVEGIDLAIGAAERAVLWEKAARLAVLAAATVATGLPVGVLRSDEASRARLVRALEETCAVAAAEGVELAPAEQLAIIDAMAPELTTSTARDVAAGRPSELDAITGSAVRAGARLRVPTPELESLLREAEAACRAR